MTDRKIILDQIKETIKEVESNSEIILFGSKARGDDHEESDWDILILLPYYTDLKIEQEFRHKLFYVELQFGQAISTHVKSKSDWEGKLKVTPLYKNILREGIGL